PRGNRSRAVVLIATILVAGIPLVGVATPTPATGNATGVAPGQQLGGVVDVGEAELETDMASRTFGLAIAQADSPAAKAAIIKDRVDAVERSVERLDERLADLRAARDNGSLSQGAYRARVAAIAAERAGAAQLANATAAASADLPVDVLEANGVNVDAIEQLRNRARELGGQEIAEIARNIAGPAVGQPPGRSGTVPGRGTDAGNATAGGPPVTPGGPAGSPGNPSTDR
ncbi:MAG: hypothetical protein ABEH64_05020, partial [Salinirussus sp.]